MGLDRNTSRALTGGLWDLAGSAGLLGCALAGFTVCFASLYTDPSTLAVSAVRPDALTLLCAQYGVRELVGFSLLLALASLAVWSLPRFRAPAVGLLCAVWAGLTWRFWEGFSNGALLTVQVIANLFADRVGWNSPLELKLGLTAMEELDAVRVFAVLALGMLSLLLGGAVVRARRWWLALLFTLPPLLPGLVADVYPNWPAFLALAACWCAMLLGDLCRGAASAGRGKLTVLTLSAALALLGGLYALNPQEGYQRPAWTYPAENALTDFGNRHLSFLNEIDGPFGGRVTYVGSAEQADLANAGPLRYTGRTVLKVTGDYTGRVYLRGSSLASYEHGVWTALEDGAYESTVQPGALSPLLEASLNLKREHMHTVTVENTGASGSCVYAPYQLAVQDWEEAGVLPVEDGYLAHRRGMWSHTLSFLPMPAAGGDGSSADPDFPDGAALAGPDPDYRELVERYYLQTPDWFGDFLREQWPQGMTVRLTDVQQQPHPVAAALGVAGLLRESCEYDPEVPAAPEGEDPVRHFLTGSRRGYCMHFASAATLLLRSWGVPARYVSGFTAQLEAGETVEVPDYAAHAWVEVYVDGFGWYPVEVTPDYVRPAPDGTGAPEASEPPVPSNAPSQAPEPSGEPSAAPSPAQTPAPGGQQGPSGGGGGRILAALLAMLKALTLPAAVVSLVFLGQAVPKQVRAGRMRDPDAVRAVLYGYGCLKRLERWGGSVPEAALELARKARFGGCEMTEEERRAMERFVDGRRLYLCESLKQPKKLLFRYWWGSPAGKREQGGTPDDLP